VPDVVLETGRRRPGLELESVEGDAGSDVIAVDPHATLARGMVPDVRRLVPQLLIAGVLPVIGYSLLRPHVGSDATALAAVMVFPLADISCGGIAIYDNKQQLGTTIGDTFPNCRIDLPEIGPVTCSLQVRNSIDMTLLNNKTSRRLGCQFVDISRGNLAAVQRYITKLERERNARIAGLT